ncbi:MAG: hypothetical protein ABIV26_09210 [Candidatus Limnocylindrales bacterium]
MLSTLSPANRRHAERIVEDVVPLLGPGVEVVGVDVELEGIDAVVITLRYRLGITDAISDGRGSNFVEAHLALRTAVVEDRIGLGLRAIL